MLNGLDSARLKLIRAAKHIKTIENSIAAYTAGDAYKIVKESDGKEELHIIREPPPEIAVLSGEVFYQTRSALDHLIFDLIKLNVGKIVLPNGWEKRCEFPLKINVPTYGNPPVPYDLPVPNSVFERILPGVSPQALTFIETMQPYYSTNTSDRRSTSSLRMLAKFSNIDKHRHLNVTVTKIRQNELISFDTGAQLGRFSIVNHKTKLKNIIGSVDPMGRAVKVERSFTAIVTFNEPEIPEGANIPVQYVLELCTNTIQAFIIPAFEKFIQHP